MSPSLHALFLVSAGVVDDAATAGPSAEAPRAAASVEPSSGTAGSSTTDVRPPPPPYPLADESPLDLVVRGAMGREPAPGLPPSAQRQPVCAAACLQRYDGLKNCYSHLLGETLYLRRTLGEGPSEQYRHSLRLRNERDERDQAVSLLNTSRDDLVALQQRSAAKPDLPGTSFKMFPFYASLPTAKQ